MTTQRPSVVVSSSEPVIPELWTVKRVGEVLGLSVPTVYRLLESGEIPYVKMGKSRRVKRADVLAYIESHTVARQDRKPCQATHDDALAKWKKDASPT